MNTTIIAAGTMANAAERMSKATMTYKICKVQVVRKAIRVVLPASLTCRLRTLTTEVVFLNVSSDAWFESTRSWLLVDSAFSVMSWLCCKNQMRGTSG